MTKGLPIAIYGASNIDIDTKLIVFTRAFAKSSGRRPKDIKIDQINYPIPKISSFEAVEKYLHGNKDNKKPIDFQNLLVANKREFEHQLLVKLDTNDMVLIRGYKGTSIAYGMTEGLKKQELINFQAGLLEPKISIFFDNENFREDGEEVRAYKIGAERFSKMNVAYRELAKDLLWHTILATNDHAHHLYNKIFDHVLERVLEKNLVPR